MSPGELLFIEPFLEKTCFCCASKGRWRRRKKNLMCEGCHTEFVILPDGKLAIASRPVVPASPA